MAGTLFLVQTPYHALLTLGLSSPGDTVQFLDDFRGCARYMELIRKHYPQLSVPEALPGRATVGDVMSERVKCSRRNLKVMAGMVDPSKFDKVVLYNDIRPETQRAACLAVRKGIPVEYVEDGLSMYVGPRYSRPDLYRRITAKVLFGMRHHSITDHGTSPCIATVKAFYPDKVKDSMRAKNVRPLDHRIFYRIDKGFVTEATEGLRADIEALLVLPVSEVLSDGVSAASLKRTADDFIARAAANGKKVGVKYHPRETNAYLGEFPGVYSVPQDMSMELVCLMLRNNGLKLIAGPPTTSLYTARIILGKEVDVRVIGENASQEQMTFLSSAGIQAAI